MNKIVELLAKVADKLYISKIRTKLQGYKTYILLAILVLGYSQDALQAIQAFLDGTIDLTTFIKQLKEVILLFAGMTAKAGIERNKPK